MTELKPDQFEMRRLESLSNTIFGVAMTLLAYDLPKAAVFTNAPGWSDLARVYSGKLAGLALSFIIAGVFWISHHRRLARQPVGSRGAVILNLFFLLSIVLLPVTNGLYTNYATSSAVSVLYGLHLTAIAGLNAWLWWAILGGWRREILAVSASGVHPGHDRRGVRTASRALRVVHRVRRAPDPAFLWPTDSRGRLAARPFTHRLASRRTRRPAHKA